MLTTSEEMINRVNADSPEGTEEFLTAYYPYFKILLKHYGCPNQEIDDLCTPVALKLLKALKTFDRRRPGSLRKLINLIVKRTLANFFKKINSKSQTPNKSTSELIPELHERDLKSDWQMKDCELLHEVCISAIENYLNRIEPVTYKALKMYVMEYRNAQEVSDLLEIPANSVYNHKRNFFLRIVDDATELYNQKTGENVSKALIAEALYNYLLDNNPALTIAESPVPERLLKQFSFLKAKLEDVESPNESGYFLKFIDSNLDWQSFDKETTVGSRKADITVGDPKVSGPHCKLSIDDEGHVKIEDLLSENGTYVNGKKINSQILMHADLIQLGSGTSLVFYQVD
ncbi:MAG: FHA domain-containing protein [Lentisphaeraceae bacterium]|nr:FHA domain-containing protein [Lentisphaeraceae bacterium]